MSQSVGDSFWNYGYWDAHTTGTAGASEQLMDYLVAKMPRSDCRVLDVAFGTGESTKRLCAMFGETNVVGINVSAEQVDAARARGVPCELRVMDAARMDFAAGSFDIILCIEAAFHFRTRSSFLERAHAILRPGGRLIMSDLLLRSGHGIQPEAFPPENEIQSLEEYGALFTEAGFSREQVHIERSTQRQIVPYMVHLAQSMKILPFPRAESAVSVSPQDLRRTWFMVTRLLNVADCVIVSAEKN